MPISTLSRWLPALAPLFAGRAHAATADGDFSLNAVVPLALLGVLAIGMGIRNLHELRYRRLVPGREGRSRAPGARTEHAARRERAPGPRIPLRRQPRD